MRSRLVEARKKKGLRVNQIANQLNISTSFYYKIEAGVRNPTIELAKEIASLFGNTVDDLFFDRSLDETSRSTA